MPSWLHWLLLSPRGLALRLVAGVCVFAALALGDLYRHGREATRWREYLFLVTSVAIALVYGVVNDQVTSRISWEYFYYGKDLAAVLGDRTPPNAGRLSWEAAKVGMQATWAVGLLVGVACLVANNPRRERPRLSYRALRGRVPLVVASAAVMAVLLGWVGYEGGLTAFSDDFRELVRHDQFRPRRFMAVYGVHLGGYVGGLLGVVTAVVSIRRARARLAAALTRGAQPAPSTGSASGGSGLGGAPRATSGG